MKNKVVYLIDAFVMVILILFDQWTKSWMVTNVKDQSNIVVIKGVFEFEYLENTGAAFSSFLGKQGFLITLTTVILVFVVIKWLQTPSTKRFLGMRLTMLLLVAGAIGNMIDRVKQGYVVDFLYFVPINFPRFNVADCYVCVAVFLLAVLLFFVYKDEESDFLFHIRKK